MIIVNKNVTSSIPIVCDVDKGWLFDLCWSCDASGSKQNTTPNIARMGSSTQQEKL